MKLSELKPGDKVVRLISSDKIPMVVTVEAIVDNIILMEGGWEFDTQLGIEVDDDLGFGPETGVTGSYLDLNIDPETIDKRWWIDPGGTGIGGVSTRPS